MTQEWTEILEVGPELAAQWLQGCSFHGQRPLNEYHVSVLAHEMEQGRFATSQIRMVHVGNKVMITDGQHRLRAILRTGLKQKFAVYHLHGTDEHAAADDYTYGGVGGKNRDPFTLFTATDTVQNCGLTPTDFRAYMASLNVIINSFNTHSTGRLSPELRSFHTQKRYAEAFAPEARAFIRSLRNASSLHARLLKRSAVFSVGLISLRYQPESAAEFWGKTADNDGLRRGEPSHTLLSFLTSFPATHFTIRVGTRKVAAAWSAHYEGRKLSLIKVVDPEAPIRISGTPYDGQITISPEQVV